MIFILNHELVDELTNTTKKKDFLLFGSESEAAAEMERQFDEAQKGKDLDIFQTILNNTSATIYGDDTSEYWEITKDEKFFPVTTPFTGMQYKVSAKSYDVGTGEFYNIPEMSFLDEEQAKTCLRTLYATMLNARKLENNFASDERGAMVPGGFLASDSHFADIFANVPGKGLCEVATLQIDSANLLNPTPEANVKERTVERTLYFVCGCISGENNELKAFAPVPFVRLEDAKNYLVEKCQRKLSMETLANKDKEDDAIPGVALDDSHLYAEIWIPDSSSIPEMRTRIAKFCVVKDIVDVPAEMGDSELPKKVSVVTYATRDAKTGKMSSKLEAFTFLDNKKAKEFAETLLQVFCREYRVPYSKTEDEIGFGWFNDVHHEISHSCVGGIERKAPFADGNIVDVASIRMDEVQIVPGPMPVIPSAQDIIQKVSQLLEDCKANASAIAPNSPDYQKAMSFAEGAESAYENVLSILKSTM